MDRGMEKCCMAVILAANVCIDSARGSGTYTVPSEPGDAIMPWVSGLSYSRNEACRLLLHRYDLN
jgi:hypothetical protein